MNINFDPFIEPRALVQWKDFPTRMSDRIQGIFLKATEDSVRPAPNDQALLVLGEFALVTGLVGIVASYYFKSDEYVSECLLNIAIGACTIGRAYTSYSNKTAEPNVEPSFID